MGNCVGGKGAKKDPKLLTEDEIKILLANTRLNRAQIIALHANFLKECPSGKLTKKDFVKLFKEVHPSDNKKEKADKFCEYVFKVIDKDKLGYISFQDFVLCFSLTSDGDFKQKCDFAFRLYDLDKDGKISKKEMTQVLTALYDLSGITDRKGNNAPAKKVENIIKKINATYKPAETEQPQQDKKQDKKKKEEKPKKEKPAKPGKPAKEEKPKKEKPAKAPEFITKEQFIEACSSDEQLKSLFVDAIFLNSIEMGTVEVVATTSAAPAPEESNVIKIEARSFGSSLPEDHQVISVHSTTAGLTLNDSVQTTTTIDLNNGEPISITTTTSGVEVAQEQPQHQEQPAEETTNNNQSDNQTNQALNENAENNAAHAAEAADANADGAHNSEQEHKKEEQQ